MTRNLQPWSPWLDWFCGAAAEELGGLLQRLQPLFGPFGGSQAGGDPLPDGLGDLTRRGPYDRLLSSEWLLADELPDEFLRRAASGEHLFLAPRPRATASSRLIVALFDAGPLQLGAPRLGHLAAWILLARRARTAGAELRWGLLQEPGRLHEEQGVDALRALLDARSLAVAGDEQAARWTEALQQQGLVPGECWSVAASAQRGAAPPFSHQLQLRRNLQGDALEVELVERRARRSASLPLPAAAAALGMLNGTFGQARADLHQRAGHRMVLKRAPVISPSGMLVAVQALDQPGALVFQVPAHSRAKPGKPRRPVWSSRVEPLAGFFIGKQFAALMSAPEDRLEFWQVPGLQPVPRPTAGLFDAPPGRASWLQAAFVGAEGDRRLFVVDRMQRLRSWSVPAPQGEASGHQAAEPQKVASLVSALVQVGPHHAIYLLHQAGYLWTNRLGPSRDARPMPVCLAPRDMKVLVAGGDLWLRDVGACAVRVCEDDGMETWRINAPLGEAHERKRIEGPTGPGTMAFQQTDVRLPPGWKAVGLVRGESTTSYDLVALASDQRSFHRYSLKTSPLYMAPCKVVACTVCPNTGLLAMLTEARQLIAYGTEDDTLRLLVQGEGVEEEDGHAQA